MIEELYSRFRSSSGVSTDTRTIMPGNIFFALRGPNFNANKFVSKALDSGAEIAVIDDPRYAIKGKTFLVDNALSTLQELAVFHRNKLKIPFLGITGSNGKTTTKELIQGVLSRKYRTYATKGNLNNHIGVPLTLLSIGDDIEIAIIEMGANKIGDIRELCQIAKPTHGLITNIGRAHIEGFGSKEGVLRGKSELYDWIRETDGTVFINSKDPVLNNMAKRFKDPVLFPGRNDFYFCELEDVYPFIRIRTGDNTIVQSKLIGAYNFSNIAAALCIGKYFDVSAEDAGSAIENYMPENNRSQILKKGTNTIILDAYNANPDSMLAALENIKSAKGGKKAVILGDMFELGDISEKEHRNIGKLTKQKELDMVIFCGERMKYASEENPDGLYFENREKLLDFLETHSFNEYLILVKGSRAMALENVIHKF